MVLFSLLAITFFAPLRSLRDGAAAPAVIRLRKVARTSRYCRTAVRIMGCQLRDFGTSGQPMRGLVVSNHLSWIDAVVLFGLRPLTFVTSTDVERAPLLGWICKRAGCLFVERRKVRAVTDDRDKVAAAMNIGAMVVFPESTSSNGETVLPFKPAMFEAARQADVPVTPLCLCYHRINEQPITLRTRDVLYWYGDMAFLPSMIRVFCQRTFALDVVPLPTITWDQVGHDRKAMAAEAHRVVCAAYHGPVAWVRANAEPATA